MGYLRLREVRSAASGRGPSSIVPLPGMPDREGFSRFRAPRTGIAWLERSSYSTDVLAAGCADAALANSGCTGQTPAALAEADATMRRSGCRGTGILPVSDMARMAMPQSKRVYGYSKNWARNFLKFSRASCQSYQMRGGLPPARIASRALRFHTSRSVSSSLNFCGASRQSALISSTPISVGSIA